MDFCSTYTVVSSNQFQFSVFNIFGFFIKNWISSDETSQNLKLVKFLKTVRARQKQIFGKTTTGVKIYYQHKNLGEYETALWRRPDERKANTYYLQQLKTINSLYLQLSLTAYLHKLQTKHLYEQYFIKYETRTQKESINPNMGRFD